MTPSILAAAFTVPAAGSLMGILFWVAVLAVVFVAIVAIVRQTGIVIPPIVRIIFWALVSIFLIVLLFKLFGVLTT